MNRLILFLGLCAVICAQPTGQNLENAYLVSVVDSPAVEKQSGRNAVTDMIEDLFENLRDVVINGKGPIPPLDPLEVKRIGPLVISDLGYKITGNIYNLRAEGLRWYTVDKVTFNALRLSMGVHITLPWLQVTGGYDARATILMVSHSSGGNFRFFLNRFAVGVDLRLGTNILGGGHLTLRELDIQLDINDITVQIDGLVGSSVLNNIINTILQNTTQELLQEYLQPFTKMLNEQLFDIINEALKEFTLEDLIGGY